MRSVVFLLSALFCFSAYGQPRPLRPDIRVEHYADVAAQSVRLAIDPIRKNLHYITFQGDLYEIRPSDSGPPESVKIASSDDHGITRLQGMAFVDSTLFLVGNIAVNEGRGTRGRLMRGLLTDDGGRDWTTAFTTDEIGSTKTTFDHGFNGITASPDGRYLYINSGARTDHGEIQDNDGHYPGARDEPLTAAILRIPTDARDLVLRNDVDVLTEDGYLYARGIRNAFDLAFSPNGHLFAVSNSGDYDHPEDMFWIREGHHYGFPWVMGGIENPQQYPDFEPDPDKDPFIPRVSHAYNVGYFRNDPTFPERPEGVTFTPPVANIGPDANYYRDPDTGDVRKGDETGTAVGTFTAHRSPLGLVFDADSLLAPEMRGDAFVLSWTDGTRSGLMGRLSSYGADLMHLKLFYSRAFDNYIVQTTRIADGFTGLSDAELIGNDLFILQYGGSDSKLWKLTLPAGDTAQVSTTNQEKPEPSGRTN